ncbi:MAG: hypothetical protein LLG06_08040 [Desulfobacteraceae bacterium]|nr:hypothetical protein [Desulfobacteraceae bacterium]
MSETSASEMLMLAVRFESTAYKQPILTDTVEELLKLVAETLPLLDPNQPGRNRISICTEYIDPEVFDKLPDL